MVSRDLFASHVKDALEVYYDTARLQANPLPELLHLPVEAGSSRVVALRQRLREAIEWLKPPAAIPQGGREWTSHRLLWLRYIQSRAQDAVCDELSLGRSAYYRHLAEALEAVAGLLWEEHRQAAVGASAGEGAMDHAVRLVRSGQRQTIDLTQVLEGVRQTLSPLEQQQQVIVHIEFAPQHLPVYCEPGLLRQVLLNLLTDAMSLAAGQVITLRLWCAQGQAHGTVGTLRPDELVQRGWSEFGGLSAAQRLLQACQGRLWVEEQGAAGAALAFSLPVAAARTVLVVDDDADTVELYRRYLQQVDVTVRAVTTASELRLILRTELAADGAVPSRACTERPALVLLDVLMPGEDGWSLLQSLKTMPETAQIPVIVCSVLSQPQLALALGAAEVLHKPVRPEEFLRAVTRWLGPADSPA